FLFVSAVPTTWPRSLIASALLDGPPRVPRSVTTQRECDAPLATAPPVTTSNPTTLPILANTAICRFTPRDSSTGAPNATPSTKDGSSGLATACKPRRSSQQNRRPIPRTRLRIFPARHRPIVGRRTGPDSGDIAVSCADVRGTRHTETDPQSDLLRPV